MGKSVFARNILVQLKLLEALIAEQIKDLMKPSKDENKDEAFNRLSTSLFDPKTSNYQLKFRFCIAQCNSEMSLQFLGIWRPIMRTLLSQMASIVDKKPKKIIQQLLEKYQHLIGNKLLFILDFFSIDDMDPLIIKLVSEQIQQVVPIN